MRALRRAARRPGGWWLVLAGALGLVAALVTMRAAATPDLSGTVLVARADLDAGARVGADDVARLPVPRAVAIPGLLSDPAELGDRRAVAPIRAGEPLTQAALGGAPGAGPAPLRPGERAVFVPLAAAGGAAGALVPGARVDAVASTGEGLAGESAIVVADAEVLGVAEAGDAAIAPEAASVVLRVGADEALALTAALNFAREVRLLVRPVGETGSPPPPARAPAA